MGLHALAARLTADGAMAGCWSASTFFLNTLSLSLTTVTKSFAARNASSSPLDAFPCGGRKSRGPKMRARYSAVYPVRAYGARSCSFASSAARCLKMLTCFLSSFPIFSMSSLTTYSLVL